MRQSIKTIALAVTAGLLAVIAATQSFAQEDTYVPARPVQSPPLWQDHASTVEEGILRGWADVGRAIGEARYNTALALVHREEAVRRNLQNRKQAVEDFFQIRRFNKNMRFQTAQRPTQEQRSRISEERLPGRLSDSEYQPTAARLAWPLVLQAERFAEERAAVNATMTERSRENSGLGSENYQQIRLLTSRIESKLRDHAEALSSAETIAARKFLASLNYEVRFPMTTDIEGLAAR